MDTTKSKRPGRVARDRVMFAVRLRRDQSERLVAESERRDVPQGIIVREALDRYLNETVR